MIKQREAESLFEYDGESGLFTRRRTTSPNAVKGSVVGTVTATGYLKVTVNKKPQLLHRLAWIYVYGCEHVGEIDHINHDRADNRIINLRDVSSSENKRNASRYKSSKSGFTGVHFDRARGRWLSHMHINNKFINLGRYSRLSDAVKARIDAEIKHGFHVNHGSLRDL